MKQRWDTAETCSRSRTHTDTHKIVKHVPMLHLALQSQLDFSFPFLQSHADIKRYYSRSSSTASSLQSCKLQKSVWAWLTCNKTLCFSTPPPHCSCLLLSPPFFSLRVNKQSCSCWQKQSLTVLNKCHTHAHEESIKTFPHAQQTKHFFQIKFFKISMYFKYWWK